MADVTFRDFAGAIMRDDIDAAGSVLQQLLGLGAVESHAAAEHFQAQSTSIGSSFMGKAMGLRSVLAGGSDDKIAALLRDCFGLADAPLATAMASLKRSSPPRTAG